MNEFHNEVISGPITGVNGSPRYFTEEPYVYLEHLPTLPQIYIDDAKSRTLEDYTYFPPERPNRTPLIDCDCLFQTSRFMKDAEKQFGFSGATILRFDPLTLLDWHCDERRRCAMNFLITDPNGKAHTLIREQKAGWNYNINEIHYDVGRPILINTMMQHCSYNYHPTETRLLLTITFGRIATYWDVREWLMNYQCTEY